eukprot:COSAG02_NODE_41830_length_390_cov_1.065292_1_plen_73_part_10
MVVDMSRTLSQICCSGRLDRFRSRCLTGSELFQLRTVYSLCGQHCLHYLLRTESIPTLTSAVQQFRSHTPHTE